MRPVTEARCFAIPFAVKDLRVYANLRVSARVQHQGSDQDVAEVQAPVVAPAPCLAAKRALPFGTLLKQA
jgi:hypothetical protein